MFEENTNLVVGSSMKSDMTAAEIQFCTRCYLVSDWRGVNTAVFVVAMDT